MNDDKPYPILFRRLRRNGEWWLVRDMSDGTTEDVSYHASRSEPAKLAKFFNDRLPRKADMECGDMSRNGFHCVRPAGHEGHHAAPTYAITGRLPGGAGWESGDEWWITTGGMAELGLRGD